jgi:hypothetical protein
MHQGIVPRPTSTNLQALEGRPRRSRGTGGQVQRPADRLDAHDEPASAPGANATAHVSAADAVWAATLPR